MPTVIPTSTNYTLSEDVLKLLVSSCIQAAPGDNFVEGFDGTPQANRFHLYPEFLDDQPDKAGVVTAQQDEMEQQPVRRASVTVMLRAESDSTGSGRQWVSQGCEAIASYLRMGTGEYRTLVSLASGRKVLSFHNARILPIGEDNAQRALSSILFEMTYTEHELSSGG